MFPIHAMPLTLGSPGGTGAVLSASCSACFASSGGSCPTKRSGASAPGCCAGAKRSRAVAWRSATRGPWDEMILTKNAGKIVEKRHIIFFYGFLWEFAVILEELNGISLGYTTIGDMGIEPMRTDISYGTYDICVVMQLDMSQS